MAKDLPGWEGVELTAPRFTIGDLKAVLNALPEESLSRAVCFYGDGEYQEIVDAVFETDGRSVTEPILMLFDEDVMVNYYQAIVWTSIAGRPMRALKFVFAYNVPGETFAAIGDIGNNYEIHRTLNGTLYRYDIDADTWETKAA